jgi:hypothetical protein
LFFEDFFLAINASLRSRPHAVTMPACADRVAV